MRKQKMVRRPQVVLALLGTLLLVGCGGSSAPQESTADADQTAAEETASQEVSSADAESALSNSGLSIGDEPSLTNADVAGIYLLDQESPTDAMFATYQLKKDGTFFIRGIVAGTLMERKGTYEIRDSRVYVNMPEGESFEFQGIKYTGSEIKDGELVIEDGVLTTSDIGTSTQTARKITRAEYDQMVEKAVEAGPKRISVGETVYGDGYTFTIDSFEFRDEVYPSDTSGYYRYWAHEDDHDYLVADVTYTNDGTEYQAPGNATAALMSIGDNNYYPSIEVDGGSRTSSSYTIDPKDSGRVIIVASIPDAAREEIAQVSLTWVFPKDPKLLNYYFKNENESKRYILTL